MKTARNIGLIGIGIFLIYRAWFGFLPLGSGDWHYLYPESLFINNIGVWGWDVTYNNGLGGSDIFLLGLNSYYNSISALLLTIAHIPWVVVERIMWFWPYLLLATFSSWYLYRTIFPRNDFWIFSTFIFISNTYMLMVIGGGQVGIAMAITLSPLLLALYERIVKAFKNKNNIHSVSLLLLMTSLVLGLQIFLDLRIVYITLVAILIFFIFIFADIFSIKKMLIIFFTFILATLLNLFWILPQALLHQNPLQELGGNYSSIGAVVFYSFAKFENTFGLMHPNWPDNIFGKVGFMKSEFLLFPLLAFSSLLFIQRKTKNEEEKQEKLSVIYFALIGIVGIFLAKGANEPFGSLYLWMFNHIPGFIMFRDPTKWYLLIVLSYMILIPYTLGEIYELLKRRFR